MTGRGKERLLLPAPWGGGRGAAPSPVLPGQPLAPVLRFLPGVFPQGPKPPHKAVHEAPSSWPPVLRGATDPAPHLVPLSLGVLTAPSAKWEQVGQGRGLPTLPFPGLPLSGREDKWEGTVDMRDGGRGGGTCEPQVRKDGMRCGQGRCLGGTWFGSFAELVLPGCQELLVRSQ